MPKIVGVKIHEYHIPAEGNSPARDFTGYKIFLAMDMAEEDGYGCTCVSYPISREDFSRKVPGYTESDIPQLVGACCGVDLAPSPTGDGKFKLVRLTVGDPMRYAWYQTARQLPIRWLKTRVISAGLSS